MLLCVILRTTCRICSSTSSENTPSVVSPVCPGQTQSVADSHGGKNVSLFVRIRPDGGHDRST